MHDLGVLVDLVVTIAHVVGIRDLLETTEPRDHSRTIALPTRIIAQRKA